MFNSLAASTSLRGEPPDASRHRTQWRPLGLLLAFVAALALGITMMAAPPPAQAATNLDGHWTVVHGGTGQLSLNADGSYTSTCVAFPNYADAWCPSPSGTFQRSSNSYVDFHGSDGINHSYRYSGDVQHPDTITSYFGSRGHAELVMKAGTNFVCTYWSDTATGLLRWGPSPLVEYDAAADLLYATGSHDLIGPKNVSTSVNLIETAPNYFEVGYACPAAPALPTMGVASILDTSVLSPNPDVWVPKATVSIKDQTGASVSGATVTGSFTEAGIRGDCVTTTDGTCTIGGHAGVGTALASSAFTTDSVVKDGMKWDEQHVAITVHSPSSTPPTPTPTPTPPTPTPTPTTAPTPSLHHVGDLDNATTASSSRWNWQPKVTATVLDSSGSSVAGASVSGTFTNHKGTLTCTTTVAGTCTLGNFSLSRSTTKTVFKVTNVVKASATYAPSANSDPDGDSNGTTITVKRP